MCKQPEHQLTATVTNNNTINNNDKKLTIQDVTSHNTPSSAYTLYQNKVLDITKFASRHPGGDIILLSAGKDATVLVNTYHPKGIPFKTIDKLTIGTIDSKELPTSYYTWSSPFYATLCQRVTHRLSTLRKPLRGTVQIQIKAITLLFGFWFSLYKMYTNNNNDNSDFMYAMLWSVSMGIFGHWVGTCIQHDGNHGAFSNVKFVNVMAGWTMDMIGASAFTWQFQHMLGHHPYTNLLTTTSNTSSDDKSSTINQDLIESDPDVFSSYPLMRMHPHHNTYWYHAYQHLYAPFLFAFMTLAKVFQQDIDIITTKKLYHIDCSCRYGDIKNVVRFWFMKGISMLYMVGLPIYFHGLKKGLLLFFIGHFTCGEVLATMFIVNHVIDGVAFANIDSNTRYHKTQQQQHQECKIDDDDGDDMGFQNRPRTTKGLNPMEKCQQSISTTSKVPYNDWAAVQCQTSVNWSKGSWFWNHFSGGLNHQIEHHLFPSICHTNYVYIQDVVEDTCREFGVPYQSEDNLWVAYGKMLRHLKIMGNGGDKKVV